MRKLYTHLIIYIFIAFFSLSCIKIYAFTESSLQQENIIKIYTSSDLAKIGNEPGWPLDGHYILMNDLIFERDLFQQTNFVRIAENNNNPFTGVFDGNGKTIKGLISENNDGIISLFGYVNGESAVIKDLGLIDIDFSGDRVGAIVFALRKGSIENCYTTGKISSKNDAGGIVLGINEGVVKNCYSSCEIEGLNTLGGIVALSFEQVTISKCYFKGNIKGKENIGGIVGYNYGLVERSYFAGKINCNNPQYNDSIHAEGTGGITGQNVGEVTNCYSLGDINGVCYIGGIAGNNLGKIKNCYSASKIYASFNYTYMGGIVGWNSGEVDRNVSIVPEVIIAKEVGGRVMGTEGARSYITPFNLIYSDVINYAWDKMKLIRKNPSLYLLPFELESIRNGQFKSLEVLKNQETYMELGWSFSGNDPIWEFSDDYRFPKLVGVGGQENLVTPTYVL